MNEPANYAISGYEFGIFAPGRGAHGSNIGNAATEPYIVAHNLLLCHATVVELYRQKFQVIYPIYIVSSIDIHLLHYINLFVFIFFMQELTKFTDHKI